MVVRKHLFWQRAVLVAVFSLGLHTYCLAANENSPAIFERPVQFTAEATDELLAIPLDAAVFAVAGADWKKSRILDEQGQVIPLLVKQATASETKKVRHNWRAFKPSLKPLPDGGLEIIVALSDKDPQPDRLRLISPITNFEQGIEVFGRAAKQNGEWQPLVEDATIFDYARYMDVRQDQVKLPRDAAVREFRILVQAVTAEQESRLLELTRTLQGDAETGRTERLTIDRRPFRIEAVEFSAEVEQARTVGPKLVDYPPQTTTVEQNAQRQQTWIAIETAHEPLTQFKLLTDDKNFSRQAIVEVADEKNGEATWRQISQGTLSRIDFKALQREDLSLTFPETQAAKYRIVIENRDARPLQITGVAARGHQYDLVMLAEPKQQYRLLYGKLNSAAPQVETAPLTALLADGYTPQTAMLGAPVAATEVIAAPPIRWTQWLNDPRVFVPLIVALVALLGWGLFRAAKRVDQLP